ncbi:MAG: DUF6701 domain-containing protein [Sulfuriferula sp.]
MQAITNKMKGRFFRMPHVMLRPGTVRACLLGMLMALMPVVASAAWFNAAWNYRVPINVPAGASVNSTIKVDVDFNALLTTLGAAGTFDVNSPRITRADGTTLSATQEFTDTVYAGATDAAGNGRGEVRFILQDAGPATYYLYFDIVANGPKAVNPQPPINGNFEVGATGTATPAGWSASTRSNNGMDIQMRPAETVSVSDSNGSPSPFDTDGNPNTGQYSYLMGYRSNADNGGNATLTKSFTVPATNPGTFNIQLKPEGWDSAVDGNTSYYDFIRVRLLNPSNSAVLLDIAGPQLNNYSTCPFGPNYSTNSASNKNPGYGYYNDWDNGTKSDNHTLGMSAVYDRRQEPWTLCSASLSSVAGKAVTLEIRVDNFNQFKSWFLVDDVEWSVVPATLGTPESGAVPPPGGFNAYDTATVAGATTGFIQTKIAGSPFNLDLIVLNTAKNAILTTFTGAVKVELLNSSAGGALDANGCNVAWPTIQTLASNPVFALTDNGRKTVSFQENNAWRNVRVRITYPATGTPTAVGCSTDNFAIRPASFSGFSVTDANWQSAGTTRSLNNMGATGGNVHKAGQPFSVTATAINALATPGVTTNYTGIPSANLTACSGSGCTTSFGIFTVGGAAAVAGVFSSSSAGYTEAGAFTLQLQDMTFASVDAGDGTPASCAGLYICSSPLVVGRFVPDHFSVTTSSTPVFKTFNDTVCTARSFTYIGQGFGYKTPPLALITAQNAAGATTQNYSSSLWRPTAAYTYTSPSGTLDTGLTTLPTVTSNNDGTGSENVNSTDLLAYARSLTTPQAPFNANISLNLSVSDTSEASVTGNGTISTTTSAIFNGGGSGMAFDAGNLFRYGRLKLSNAFGSELLDLPIPVEAQYWNGNVFVTNTADNCTTITAANIAMGNYLPNLSPCMTAISVSGRLSGGKSSNLKLVKPGAGNNGSVDLTVNLGATASGQTCVAPPTTQQSVTAANQSYLQGKWSGTNYNQNPQGRATFGVYKNANEFIYMREMY